FPASLMVLIGLGSSLYGFAQEKAQDIVKKADQIRAPDSSYQVNATVTNFEGDKEVGKQGYQVYIKDLGHAVVEFQFPASEKGKSMLMLEEDVWIYLPKVSRPIRVPLKQRLLGQVAIGDMTRANFSKDYEAKLMGEEELEGKQTFVIELKAYSPKKAYHRIKYWVEKDTYRPVKAEYFTISGKSLKTGYFKDFRMEAGKTRPMAIHYQDSLDPEKLSYLRFQNMVPKDLPENMFTKQYMRTFE
ncbi:MAG: outer membrane lipoprotein-sorting protein, partial [bacterium]|nr:outer membrane lipoprotein-sorting protein [bacterium]